jgi:hypothetical protein
MPRPPKPPEELLGICHHWSEAVEEISGDAARIEFFQNELPGFAALTRICVRPR